MPNRRRLTAGLYLCVLAIAFESMAVTTAMPAAAAELGQLELYAWAFTLFVIGMTFAVAASGGASDRIGPVAPALGGLAVFTVGLVIAGAAPTMPVLLAGRLVQGLGGGALNLGIMVLVGRVYDEKSRAQVMTGFSLCWMGPSVVGPALSAWVSEHLSWHWVFWGLLPLLVLAGALVVQPMLTVDLPSQDRADGAPGEQPDRRWHHVGLAALVALGAAAIQLAGQRAEWTSLLWLAGGIALLWVGLPPLLPAGFVWGGPKLAAVVTVRTLTTGAFFGAQAFIPLMLVESHHLGLFEAGLTLTIGSLGWSFGSWLQSRPWVQLERNALITLGTVCVMAGLLLVTILGAAPGTWLGLAALGWVLAGLGMGLQVASTSLAVMQLSEAGELGRNTSSLQVGEALGNSLCGGIAGTIFVLTRSMHSGGITYGGLLAAMLVISGVSALVSRRIGHLENHSLAR